MRRFIARLINVFRRDRVERDLAREMASHLAALEDEYVRRGLSPEDAQLAARRAMGSVALAADRHRDTRSLRWLDDLRQDLRHTRRGLQRTPGFTSVAVLTVALGVGANVAIFGLVYQTLIKPLPFKAPDRLVTVATYIPQLASRFPLLPVAAPDFLEYHRSNTVFEALSALQPRSFNLTGGSEPERLNGARVSGNFFQMLDARPERGRLFAPDEDADGRNSVVILSHALWTRRFGSDPAVVGRTIALDGRPHDVIGIMPADLLFPVGRQLDPIGLRVALGAEPGTVIRMVMREGLRPVAIGLVIGLVAGQVAAQSIRSLLFGIGAFDPLAIGGMASVVGLTAALACYVPARRAASVEPLTALRAE